MISLFLSLVVFAAELPGEEVFVAPTLTENKLTQEKKETLINKRDALVKTRMAPRNLPQVYQITSGRQSTSSELVTQTKGSAEIFSALKVGDSLDLNVEHSVIAFTDEKSPVVGITQHGAYRGLKFIGESYLEPNSRRIFINFYRVVLGDRIFDLKGSGIASNGQPGLPGEYHSREAEYFMGDFISSFVAGYFDGLVPRKTNAFGQIETDPSVDTAVKKGLSNGALSTAERFREKIKKVPEFSELKGPFNLKILILEQAKTVN